MSKFKKDIFIIIEKIIVDNFLKIKKKLFGKRV